MTFIGVAIYERWIYKTGPVTRKQKKAARRQLQDYRKWKRELKDMGKARYYLENLFAERAYIRAGGLIMKRCFSSTATARGRNE